MTEQQRQLWEQYRPLVEQIIRRNYPRYLPDEDVYQSGLIGLWEGVRDWPGEGCFEAWAGACIRNNICDWLRRADRQRRAMPLDAGRVDREEEPLVQLDDKLLGEHIRQVWGDNSREGLILTALARGVRPSALAAGLGLDVRTVKKIAKRALDGLSCTACPSRPEGS